MGAIDVRLEVIQTKTIYRCVNSLGVEVGCIQLRHLAPCGHLRRSDVLPRLAAIAGDLDQAVICARPDQISIFWRWRQRVNHATMLPFRGIGLHKCSEARGNSGIFSSEVWADDLPIFPASSCFEQNIGTEVQSVRIDWRKNQRRGPIEAELPGAQRHRRNIFGLPRRAIELADLSSKDEIRIQRVGRNVSVLLDTCRIPVPKADAAKIAPA